MTRKIYPIDKIFCHLHFFIIKKNIFKVALQYLFNVFMILNVVLDVKLKFKLKVDPKIRTFKTLENIKKKNEWQT